jgi:TraB/PrgY/gumN family
MVLLEGVTDNKNLLTNGVTYKRMAKALGLGEQHEDFQPCQGTLVSADVDVAQFTTNTINMLNLVMLLHSKGWKIETLLKLIQYSPTPQLQQQVMDDLLTKRNQHLLQEIQTRLAQTEHIVVPWGAAHMPEIAKEIQKSGFRLDESREFVVIRFHPF